MGSLKDFRNPRYSLDPIISELSDFTGHEGGHRTRAAVAVALWAEVLGVAELAEDLVVGGVAAEGRVERSFAIEARKALLVEDLQLLGGRCYKNCLIELYR